MPEKKYYDQRPEYFCAKNRERRKANPLRERAYAKTYVLKLKKAGVYKERKHATYLRRKTKHKLESMRWQAANRPKVRAFFKRWYSKNPEKCSKLRAVRRARMNGNKVGNLKIIAAWERRWRLNESATCFWCLKTFPVTECEADHIIAVANGGEHSIENLCISCAPCNQKKQSKSLPVWNNLISEPTLI